MRRLLKWILNLLTLVFALLLAGAYISRVVNPDDFWPLSFLGLIFPVIIVFSIVLLIILIVLKNKSALILIAILLIGWQPIKESFQLFTSSDTVDNNPGVRIMSYNVRVFDYFRWSGKENSGQMLLEFVAQQQPDIICFQEFMIKNKGDFDLANIGQMLNFAPNKYTKYFYESRSSKIGLAIFSKHPIVNTGGEYLSDSDQLYIYADIKIKDDTIRLFNVHMESNHLSQQQVNLIDSLITANPKEKKTEYLGIIRKMKSSYIRRAGQAVQIHDEILLSPHPVIVSGDFNDTPVSYSYRTLSEGLKDAFVSSGHGLGATYREFMLPLRIDYLLHDPEISSSNFITHDVEFSDHRPIEAIFRFDDSKRERR